MKIALVMGLLSENTTYGGNIGEVASKQCRTGFLGGFCWVTGLFCANPRLFPVAEVALTYPSHRAFLVSAETWVLHSCFTHIHRVSFSPILSHLFLWTS